MLTVLTFICIHNVFAALQISTPSMHNGGKVTDGHTNANEHFIQIWRKLHKLCTFPNNTPKFKSGDATIAQRMWLVKASETT